MCGDHLHSMLVLAYEEGSPPHVRGPRHSVSWDAINAGITPACAGTTRAKLEREIGARDHPRMCGDHSSTR